VDWGTPGYFTPRPAPVDAVAVARGARLMIISGGATADGEAVARASGFAMLVRSGVVSARGVRNPPIAQLEQLLALALED
jgi:hypothetical protein